MNRWRVPRVIWPQDYNRPLSSQEQAIARRLDREPEKTRVASFLQSKPPELQAQRIDSGAGERRDEDVERRPKRTWFDVEC